MLDQTLFLYHIILPCYPIFDYIKLDADILGDRIFKFCIIIYDII